MTLTSTTDDTKKQQSRLQWRRQVIRALQSKGFAPIGEDMRNCGCSFRVEICHGDINHLPKAIPIHCGLRICPECEARESYRKLARYLPALQALLTPSDEHPDYRLRKLVLTTPYGLTSLDATTFKQKQKLVNDFLNRYFFDYFLVRGELSKREIIRGRCDLKKHGIGGLRAAEFGEHGKKLHWHILIYSPYMPHDAIVAAWREVTGDECQVASVSGLYASKTGELEDSGDLLGAIKEIVKYATKFMELRPRDVPHLYTVLKGNRRFQSFGILYGIELPDEEELANVCKECGAEHELLSVGQYVTRCENHNSPVSDEIATAVELGIAIYLTREPEISSGKSERFSHKGRDALESDVR